MIFLNFNFLNGKISAFLEEKLFHNGDIKNTISSISEMYNDKVVPVLNNFSLSEILSSNPYSSIKAIRSIQSEF